VREKRVDRKEDNQRRLEEDRKMNGQKRWERNKEEDYKKEGVEEVGK
jgi:hypothetical protein